METTVNRRQVLTAAAAVGAATVAGTGASAMAGPVGHARPRAELVLLNGRVATLDSRCPSAQAVGIRDGRIVMVGSNDEVRAAATDTATVINLRGRRVIPGLNDSHTHLIRQGLSYTNELSLANVTSVGEALALIKRQVRHTPPPQWVRVVGGFTKFQFAEGRLPTIAEINRVSGDTPVFLLHLYDRAIVNRAGMRVLGYDTAPPNLPDSEVERDAAGRPTGMLIAKPNATILYSTLAKLPLLDPQSQVVSTRLYMRHLNRRGVTSVVDAGGGGQVFPDNYDVITDLHARGELTVRIGYHVFTQQSGGELADFQRIAALAAPGDGDAMLRLIGAGEMLAFSGSDFEDFFQPRPVLPARMENDLTGVLQFLRERRWPFRLHATYEESIVRFLDVIEQVHGPGGPDVRFILDHAETITERTIDRVAALGGGIAVQGRMAYQGEAFAQRYGTTAASASPPVTRMMSAGVPVGLGTDATRVAGDNVWNVLYWLTSGRTLGGQVLLTRDRRPSRLDALRQMTVGSAWMSSEENVKGTLSPGRYADLAVLSDDYLTVDEHRIPDITSVLTVVNGKIVHAEQEHAHLNPPLPPTSPDYSPLKTGTNQL